MSKFLKRDISTIFIMLGNECNLRCKYCLQHCGELKALPRTINPDIYDFIKEVAEDSEHLCLNFFGGEPTLYFKQIKEIVEHTKDMKVRYLIFTNGRAITKEIADYFNEHDFHIAISWDGYNVKETRGYDVFKENRDNIMTLNNMGMSSVLTSKAYPKDLIKAQEEISEEYYRIHGYYASMNIDLVFDTGSVADELLDIDFERLERETYEIMADHIKAMKANDLLNPLVHSYFMYLQSYISNGQTYDDVVTARCGNGINVYNLDLAGNLYSCHNEFEPVGNIYSAYDAYLRKVIKKDNTIKRQGCKGCIAFPFCKKGCKLIPNGKRQESYCKIYTAFYGGMIRALIDYGNTLEVK